MGSHGWQVVTVDLMENFTLSATHIALAAAFALAFAWLGWRIRGVTTSGAVAGACVCFLLLVGAGPGAVAGLGTVFALTWVTTLLGRQHKQRLGTAEAKTGRRASQVFANLGIAAICATVYRFYDANPAWLIAMAAALSEAAADTVSSEIGQVVGKAPRLITTWRTVPTGTDGGVTLSGTLAGTCAAAIVALASVHTGIIPSNRFALVVAAAVGGMLADSLLGAMFERKKLLNNDAVNLLGTAVAAGFVWVVMWR
jgi:uncharacterized protein (TIGR00297 family)